MSSNCNNNSVDALQSIAAQPRGQWRTGMWSQCSASCGVGVKKRYVACLNDEVVLHEHDCDLSSKPDSQQKCEVVCIDSSEELHQWRVGVWGDCPITCDEVIQRRLVRCYHPTGRIVEESLCHSSKKPEETKVCTLVKCKGEWKAGNWTQCSKSCGSDGIEKRKVECIDSNGSAIEDNLCLNQSKPLSDKPCNRIDCPESDRFEWRLGQWEECKSSECNDNNGTQQRRVFCVNKNDESVALNFCGTPIPTILRYCTPKVNCSPNPNLIQVMTDQTSLTTQSSSTTPSYTLSSSQQTVALTVALPVSLPVSSISSISTSQNTPSISSLATTSSTTLSTHSEPIVWTQLTTTQTPLISSTFVGTETTVNLSVNSGPNWLYTEWSQCSVSCGNGTQTRQRFCSSHSELDCNSDEKPDLEVRHCFRLCSLFQWKTYEWTDCSASCGKGYKTRIIQCLDWTNSVVPNQFCDPFTKPKSIGHCKTHTCPYVWQTSEWSQCSKSCSQGQQVRRVSCHRVNSEGWVDNQAANKKKPIKQLLSGWCNETIKPIAKRVCNFGYCERGAVWKAGSWQPCSTSCGNGKQRRKVHCFSLKAKKLPKSYCEPKYRPQKRRKCNLRPCAPISCSDIHKRGNVKNDGEYDIYVRGRMIKIYCHDMQSGRPLDYLTLKTGYLENYSEIYNKRPTKADVCSYRGDRCEDCVTSDARIGGGLTQFSKIRINITSLFILTNDFRFSETRDGGWQIAYGEAGDCYSVVDCPQGQFKINLKGTGLSVSPRSRWLLQGNRATKQIERLDGGRIVFGRCGGYCGRCTPSNGLYLDLAL